MIAMLDTVRGVDSYLTDMRNHVDEALQELRGATAANDDVHVADLLQTLSESLDVARKND